QIEQAVGVLAGVEGVYFDERYLVQDVIGVAEVFPDVGDFEAAITATARMLRHIVEGKVDTSSLGDDYEGWECCHYQPVVAQGGKATMRIMFARDGQVVRVRGFGDRRLPEDFYRRMAEIGRLDS
ncbi:MAG: hypothetical protein IJ087_22130, partial [Eggerthellaceae bacterium]|nr:hypothetical protein [Eggerthellaceae bacterium]